MAESPTSGGVQPRADTVGAARSWLTGRSLRWYAAAIALVPFLALVWRFDFVCDDAYISYRYAFNLALGEGLRLGEEPPPFFFLAMSSSQGSTACGKEV